MPKYAMLIYSAPNSISEAEAQAQMPRWFSYTDELMANGGQAGEALHPVETATTVRVRDGETLITDGPFAETKEVLGGFYIIDAPDLDTATKWAAKMPNISYGSVEVRPVVDFDAT